MEYRTLGNTGTVVSTLCLGTMTFGAESDEKVAHVQLDRFLEQGGNFVDTADVYADGESEAIIGRWLGSRAGARDRVVIATKGRFPWGEGPNEVGLSRVGLTRALEASLARLGVEVIDLYQAHAWDPLTPIEETLGFLDDAVRAGKIQYVGVSNFIGWQLQKTALLARHLGLAPIVTLQPQYNLLQRAVELELVQVCLNEGIGLLPWSPLGGGWLTGKYRRDLPPAGTTRLGEDPDRGMEAYGRRNPEERTWRVIEAVRSVAEARGVSMAQVALAWLVDRPAVTSVIVGARTLEQLDDNLGAAGLHLSAEETARLDEASTPIVDDYPYGELGVSQRDRGLPAPWSSTPTP
jgi:aryl-alcohol dehydrogenase-like predicted oxidoreductase